MIKQIFVLLFVWTFIAFVVYLGAAFTFLDWNWFEMADVETRGMLFILFFIFSFGASMFVYT